MPQNVIFEKKILKSPIAGYFRSQDRALIPFPLLQLSNSSFWWWCYRGMGLPDDWGRTDGRAPRGSCLAISAHLSGRGAGTAPPRWGGERMVQNSSFSHEHIEQCLKTCQM